MPNFFIWVDFIVLQIFNDQKYVLKKTPSIGYVLSIFGTFKHRHSYNYVLIEKKKKQNKQKKKSVTKFDSSCKFDFMAVWLGRKSLLQRDLGYKPRSDRQKLDFSPGSCCYNSSTVLSYA